MRHFLVPTLSYLAPSLYLLSVAFFSFRSKKSSDRKSVFAMYEQGLSAIVMFASNAFFNGLFASLRALVLAIVVFLFLLSSRLLSKNGVFSLPIALLALPVMAWIAFLPGFLVVVIVSVVRISRLAGTGYIRNLGIDAALSMGVAEALSGNLAKVSIVNLPIPTAADKKQTGKIGDVHRATINLFFYLGVSVALFGIITLIK